MQSGGGGIGQNGSRLDGWGGGKERGRGRGRGAKGEEEDEEASLPLLSILRRKRSEEEEEKGGKEEVAEDRKKKKGGGRRPRMSLNLVWTLRTQQRSEETFFEDQRFKLIRCRQLEEIRP